MSLAMLNESSTVTATAGGEQFDNASVYYNNNGSGVTVGLDSSGKDYYYLHWARCRDVPLPPPPDYRPLVVAKNIMWQTVPMFLIVFGLVGNILTIVVLTRSTKKMKSTVMYLLVLAVSDITFLLNAPVRQWTRFVFKYDLRNYHPAVCKISAYLTYTSLHFSAWLLVAVTVERVISVLMPHRVRTQCNTRVSLAVIITLLLATCALDSHILIFVSNKGVSRSEVTICQPLGKDYKHFWNKQWSWIHFVASFVAPFFILFIGNVIIIKSLMTSQKQRKQLSTSSRGSADHNDTRSITTTLILLSVVFFISQCPTIYFMYGPSFLDAIRQLPCDQWEAYTREMDMMWIWYTIASLLGYTNATFNFVMYVISGSRFRNDLMAILCCKPVKSDGLFGSTTRSSRYTTVSSVSGSIKENSQVAADKYQQT